MKAKLIKINTVMVKENLFDPISGKVIDKVPLICFSGRILKVYGFEAGRRFEVWIQKDKMMLKAKEFKYQNKKTKKRR